jgi:hypothetical protein
VNTLLWNRREAKRTTSELPTKPERLVAKADAREMERSPEETLLTREHAERALALLRKFAAQDTIVLRIVACIEEGVDEPKEQARALDVPVTDVYNAQKRLGRYVAEVRKILDSDDDDEAKDVH